MLSWSLSSRCKELELWRCAFGKRRRPLSCAETLLRHALWNTGLRQRKVQLSPLLLLSSAVGHRARAEPRLCATHIHAHWGRCRSNFRRLSLRSLVLFFIGPPSWTFQQRVQGRSQSNLGSFDQISRFKGNTSGAHVSETSCSDSSAENSIAPEHVGRGCAAQLIEAVSPSAAVLHGPA